MRLTSINQVEAEREFVRHLVTPLEAQRCGRQDEHSLNAPPQQKFAEDESSFDRFTQADVVGDKEIDAWHAQRLEQRHELIVLDLHGAVEGARDGKSIDRAGTVGVQIGRRGRPSGCPQ